MNYSVTLLKSGFLFLLPQTVGRCFKYKTSVIKGNLNPVWNESFDVVVDDVWHQTMNIALFDEDRINKDDSLGTLVPFLFTNSLNTVEMEYKNV